MPRTLASLADRNPSNKSTHYSSMVQQPPQLTLIGESLVLKSQGIYLDTLKHAGPATGFHFGDEQANKVLNAAVPWLKAYESFCRNWAPDPYHNGEARSNVISKMLVGDRTDLSRPGPLEYNNSLERPLFRMRSTTRSSQKATSLYTASLGSVMCMG